MHVQILLRVGVWIACVLVAMPIFGQRAGTVTGTVFDSTSRAPLPGASVRLRGSNFVAVTDLAGTFVIGQVPPGPQLVEVTYLGYREAASPVELDGNGLAVVEIGLERVVAEQVTVTADPLLVGQAKALNQQKSAPNVINVVAADQIESFPDRNSAEALQRLPGILIERDQGEGRYVVVRGTEARLNYTSLDGSQIPAPEGDVRLVALDVVPADALASIEVSKTLTPDMDGDAIGGAINLVTKTAPARGMLNAQAGFGFNDIRADLAVTGNVGFGRRSADGRSGILVAGSALDTDRGSDNFEVSYDDGELEELEYRGYTINRKRYGANLAADYEPSDRSELILRGNYFDFRDQEYRRLVSNQVADGRLERELKDRYEQQEIYGGSLTGNNLVSRSWQLDYKISYLASGESEPDAFYSTFRQEDVEFAPNVSPDAIDPDNIQANPLNEDIGAYRLDGLVHEQNRTTENNFAVRANATLSLPAAESFGGLLRFGGLFRDKNKQRDNTATEFDIDDDVFLTGVPEGEGIVDILGGRYPIGLFQDAPAMLGLARTLERDHGFEEDLADCDADETVWAGYGMAELFFGADVSLNAGVRYENTDVTYQGFELLYDEEGDFASIVEQTGSRNYGEWLPMVNFKWKMAEETFLRAAVTRSFARPNYVDLTPARLILQEDLEIEQGNPNLDPTTAWNFDLMFERYLPSVGALAVGGFYKDIQD